MLAVLGASVALTLAPGIARATAYTIQYVYLPGYETNYLTSINNLGQVVGYSAYGPGGAQTGFLVSGGVVSTVTVPGANTTRLGGINDLGQIDGQYYSSLSGSISGFIDSNGVITSVRPPGFSAPLLTGINNAGDVIGTGNSGYDAFVIRNGQVTVLNSLDTTTYAINNSGIASGSVSIAGHDQGFIYDGAFTTVEYPGATSTDFGAINDLGQVVGYATFGDTFGRNTTYVSFIYSNGVFSPFSAILPGEPVAMNDNGVFIGVTYDTTLKVPYDDAGDYYQGAQVGFIATPVPTVAVSTPEPASFAVLGMALVGLVAQSRKQRSQIDRKTTRRKHVFKRWGRFRQ